MVYSAYAGAVSPEAIRGRLPNGEEANVPELVQMMADASAPIRRIASRTLLVLYNTSGAVPQAAIAAYVSAMRTESKSPAIRRECGLLADSLTAGGIPHVAPPRPALH